ARFEGYQIEGGQKQSIRITAKLVSKHEDKLVIERTYVPMEGDQKTPSRVQTFIAMAEVVPQEQPMTSPDAKITRLRGERVTVNGKTLGCQGESIDAGGDFPQGGHDINARVYTNNSVPGGLVKIAIQLQRDGRPYKFDGKLVDYQAEEARASR